MKNLLIVSVHFICRQHCHSVLYSFLLGDMMVYSRNYKRVCTVALLCQCFVKSLGYFQCFGSFCKANAPSLSDPSYCKGKYGKVLIMKCVSEEAKRSLACSFAFPFYLLPQLCSLVWMTSEVSFTSKSSLFFGPLHMSF